MWHSSQNLGPDWDEYRADPELRTYHRGAAVHQRRLRTLFPPRSPKARDRFAGELTVKTGMEFGVQSHTIGRFDELFERFTGEWGR